jgi:hypothetical protein
MRNHQIMLFLKLKHENDIQKSYKKKYALATLTSSDLSVGNQCSHSASRDPFPLNIGFTVKISVRE